MDSLYSLELLWLEVVTETKWILLEVTGPPNKWFVLSNDTNVKVFSSLCAK